MSALMLALLLLRPVGAHPSQGAQEFPDVPGAPSGLIFSAGVSTLSLNWDSPGPGSPVSSYVIEAGSRSGASDLATVDTGSTATRFEARDVAAGTYYIRIRAKGAGGLGPPSNEIVVTLGGSVPACPNVPSGSLRADVSGTTVTLSWRDPRGGGTPTSYVIEVGSSSGASNLFVTDTRSTATSLVATNVAEGIYYVRVRAKNACGTSGPSEEGIVIVGSLPPSPVPPACPRPPTGQITLNDGEALRTTFTVSPTANTDLLLTVLSSAGSGVFRSWQLFNGNTLLGTQSVEGLATSGAAFWKTATSQYTVNPATIIDFSSILNGTIQGRAEFVVRKGPVLVDLSSVFEPPAVTAARSSSSTSFNTLTSVRLSSLTLLSNSCR